MKCILYYYIVYFISCLSFLFVFYLFLENTCSNSLLICLNQLTPYMAPDWGNDPKISSQSISRQMREMNRLQSRAISKCLRGFHPWEISSIFFLAKLYRDKPRDCIAYLVTSWGQSAWRKNQDRPKLHCEVEKHADNIYKDLNQVRSSVICIFQLRVVWFNNYPTLGRFKWIWLSVTFKKSHPLW